MSFAVPALNAQSSEVGEAERSLGLPSEIVPETIFGVPCKFHAGNQDFAPTLQCLPNDIINQPSIVVTVKTLAEPQTRADMEARFREGLHERMILRVVDKGDFTLENDQESVGFKALYQTDVGNRYVWSVLSKGRKIVVVATILSYVDIDALVRDIETKIFRSPQS
ncbi:hypothetical protein WAB17_07045 [Parerythrobacter aurantius]|uniref:hypothetical protein n=1 Tax=Parerythrobacter aurantius TaxID=3127706 RepID=UPI0032538165